MAFQRGLIIKEYALRARNLTVKQIKVVGHQARLGGGYTSVAPEAGTRQQKIRLAVRTRNILRAK